MNGLQIKKDLSFQKGGGVNNGTLIICDKISDLAIVKLHNALWGRSIKSVIVYKTMENIHDDNIS